jgi:Predicted nucleoside-diphosphate sugar epimerases
MIASLRNRLFFAIDAILLPSATLLAFLIRFEGWSWTATPYGALALYFIAVATPIKLAGLRVGGVYQRLWRYASISDTESLVKWVLITGVLAASVGLFVLPALDLPRLSDGVRLPISVAMLDALIGAGLLVAPRAIVRSHAGGQRRGSNAGSRRAMIVGAGQAGALIGKELTENPQVGLEPVGFVDDDRTKLGQRIHNLPVLGELNDLPRLAEELGVEEVLIAMPTAPGSVVREVVRRANAAQLRTLILPGMFEIISGRKSVNALRKVKIEDLLRRDSIHTDLDQVASLVTDRTVLVTGAGGSIGSELVRQLSKLNPERIVVLGRGENSIFELLQELTHSFPACEYAPVIADVRDIQRIQRVMHSYRPFSVFHAAAHKHVPLMEQNVSEAVLNNVLGTRNVVTQAAEVEAEHFVLVSTDKAVRPTSVMGATKRIAELVVHETATHHLNGYVSVRFGNVLGSRGSVVPTFVRQISAGGPVTITHPEMTRYFMTIPEAVQLVLQAAAMGERGEVFVLDMGEPVRVVDLATDLIRLSGLEVDKDIEIRFTGLRPGEKLYEELFFSSDTAAVTEHPKILRAREVDSSVSTQAIEDLIQAAAENLPQRELRRMIHAIVPEYSGMVSDTDELLAIKNPRGSAVKHDVTGGIDMDLAARS